MGRIAAAPASSSDGDGDGTDLAIVALSAGLIGITLGAAAFGKARKIPDS
jgi:hypothetical protein